MLNSQAIQNSILIYLSTLSLYASSKITFAYVTPRIINYDIGIYHSNFFCLPLNWIENNALTIRQQTKTTLNSFGEHSCGPHLICTHFYVAHFYISFNHLNLFTFLARFKNNAWIITLKWFGEISWLSLSNSFILTFALTIRDIKREMN